jgi:hypothetical protein
MWRVTVVHPNLAIYSVVQWLDCHYCVRDECLHCAHPGETCEYRPVVYAVSQHTVQKL